MTQEEKELSFIDISGRLHYGVIVNYKENEYDHRKWKITNLHTLSYGQSGSLIDTDYDGWISYEEHKGCGMSSGSRPFRFGEVLPYLRPMSSMAPDEEYEYHLIRKRNSDKSLSLMDCSDHLQQLLFPIIAGTESIDWLNARHFDYRNLIGKGLAIEAPEGMYK